MKVKWVFFFFQRDAIKSHRNWVPGCPLLIFAYNTLIILKWCFWFANEMTGKGEKWWQPNLQHNNITSCLHDALIWQKKKKKQRKVSLPSYLRFKESSVHAASIYLNTIRPNKNKKGFYNNYSLWGRYKVFSSTFGFSKLIWLLVFSNFHICCTCCHIIFIVEFWMRLQ